MMDVFDFVWTASREKNICKFYAAADFWSQISQMVNQDRNRKISIIIVFFFFFFAYLHK